MSWGQGCCPECPTGTEPEEFSKDRQHVLLLGQENPLLGCGSGTAKGPGNTSELDRASSVPWRPPACRAVWAGSEAVISLSSQCSLDYTWNTWCLPPPRMRHSNKGEWVQQRVWVGQGNCSTHHVRECWGWGVFHWGSKKVLGVGLTAASGNYEEIVRTLQDRRGWGLNGHQLETRGSNWI